MTGVSEPLNIRIASGTQARIGIGRKVSNNGKMYSRKVLDQPMNRPKGTPSAVARKKAIATRRTLTPMCW